MSVEYARKALESKQRELVRQSEKRAHAQKKLTDAVKKENDARNALAKAKTESSIKSKRRSRESANKNLLAAQKAAATADSEYSKKEKAVADAQKKLAKEEETERKKQLKENKAAAKQNEMRHSNHDSAIRQQGNAISRLDARVEKLEQLPETITVLMLSSGPDDQIKLRQDKEAREIRDAIQRSKNRDSIIFEDRWAIRTEDLFQAINETEPTIIHFSGHGSKNGDLIMEDDFGCTKTVRPDTMARVLNTVTDNVKLLVFNACFSMEQAKAVTEYAEAAIGMGDSISDRAAIIFSSRFYSALGFGLSLQKAYDQACASLLFDCADEVDTPQLYVRDGLNPDELHYVEN